MIHAASTLFWSDVPRGSQCTCVTEMRTSLCCSCELAVTVKVTPKKCYTWISVVTVTSRQLRKCLAEQSKSAFKCVWWLAVIGSGWIEVGTFSPQIWWKVCAFTSDGFTFVIPSICSFRTILCIFECQKMCGLRLRKPPSYEDWHRGSFFGSRCILTVNRTSTRMPSSLLSYADLPTVVLRCIILPCKSALNCIVYMYTKHQLICRCDTGGEYWPSTVCYHKWPVYLRYGKHAGHFESHTHTSQR